MYHAQYIFYKDTDKTMVLRDDLRISPVTSIENAHNALKSLMGKHYPMAIYNIVITKSGKGLQWKPYT